MNYNLNRKFNIKLKNHKSRIQNHKCSSVVKYVFDYSYISSHLFAKSFFVDMMFSSVNGFYCSYII